MPKKIKYKSAETNTIYKQIQDMGIQKWNENFEKNIKPFQGSFETEEEADNAMEHRTDIDFISIQIENVKWDTITLKGSCFDHCIIKNVSFIYANISISSFQDCIFEKCDFSYAQFDASIVENTNFIDCDFIGSNLYGLVIDNKSKFTNCKNLAHSHPWFISIDSSFRPNPFDIIIDTDDSPDSIFYIGLGSGGCFPLESFIQTYPKKVNYLAINNTMAHPALLNIHTVDTDEKKPSVTDDEVAVIKNKIQSIEQQNVLIVAMLGGRLSSILLPLVVQELMNANKTVYGVFSRPFHFMGNKQKPREESFFPNIKDKFKAISILESDDLKPFIKPEDSIFIALKKVNWCMNFQIREMVRKY